MTPTVASAGRNAPLIGFLWGLAESTVFFIVPDVGVAYIALVTPGYWWKAAATSVLGALVGAVLLFLAVQFWLHQEVRHLLTVLPGIHPATLAAARSRISLHGPGALLGAAFSGIPYKVFAAELTLAGTSLPVLLAWTIPSRALRLFPVAAIAGLFGGILRPVIARNFRVFTAAYALAWAVFYGWYWSRPSL